ncbi:hypothetical protein OHB26_37205 [Nocardia sp. NBC_01503]|uniref:hypothetical protein n=1 Tax=Nocardia sp. NBC_01503 TaxID=2975997 RepID=UPI002E7B19D7|nr:hypothetical protein [Nocardia sp. NBC_01503]WTL32438.1 hypothetical protein OHB26_37205 [Nocardia sp. NBC_01503]
MTIGIGVILGALFVAIAIATLALAFPTSRGESLRRVLAAGGLAVGLIGIVLVLTAQAAAETKIALASMHVVADSSLAGARRAFRWMRGGSVRAHHHSTAAAPAPVPATWGPVA